MDVPKLPLLGDQFPSLTVQTTQGPMTLPDDYAGQWFVLFSHPADFTPVCTSEFVAFQEKFEAFQELDCALIGLSVDQIYCHIKWIEWIQEHLDVEIKFPVIDSGRSPMIPWPCNWGCSIRVWEPRRSGRFLSLTRRAMCVCSSIIPWRSAAILMRFCGRSRHCEPLTNRGLFLPIGPTTA